ncbi:MAG: GNAT family N-acetyltransferase [Chloroflexota bacterium]|nr:GNAT family N-acetyltransferase [Chloroflexota bacterium]
MDLHIRRIGPDDAALLRELRLRSLADSPEAFGQPLDDAVARPEAEWVAQARAASEGDRRAWFFAEAGGPGEVAGPVGIVLVRRRPPDVALVFSMWVDPRARRAGVGRALIQTASEWAASWGADRVVLWVVAGNEPACRFYQRLGFTWSASGPDADAGRAYGALAMTKAIAGAAIRTP